MGSPTVGGRRLRDDSMILYPQGASVWSLIQQISRHGLAMPLRIICLRLCCQQQSRTCREEPIPPSTVAGPEASHEELSALKNMKGRDTTNGLGPSGC